MAALEARVEAETARIDDANEALGKLELVLQLRLSENDRHAELVSLASRIHPVTAFIEQAQVATLSSCLYRPGDAEQVLSAPIGDRLRSPAGVPALGVGRRRRREH
jgi:hypothetical protein